MRTKLLFFTLILAPWLSGWAATQWTTLEPGLDYVEVIPNPDKSYGKIHAFKVDLDQYALDLAFATDQQRSASSASKLAKANQALVAINGGFFTPERDPVGLRIKDHQVRSPMQPTSWWGVFYLQDNTPHIVSQQRFKLQPNITLAVQAGPRLIVDGSIPTLKPGIAERSAICITADKHVILAATERLAISTTEFADYLRQDGLNCRYALNLDGGHSTQLFAEVNDFQLSITGLSGITDAIIVKK